MEFYENKDVKINCPNCEAFLTKADKRDRTTHKLACKNCNKWIWFVPHNGEMEIKEVPKRNTASGMTFY